MDTSEIHHFVICGGYTLMHQFVHFCCKNNCLIVQKHVCARGHHHYRVSVPHDVYMSFQTKTMDQMMTYYCSERTLAFEIHNHVI
jgi:hypothetical protein